MIRSLSSYYFLIVLYIPLMLFSQDIKPEEIEIKNGVFSLPETLSYNTKKTTQPLVIYVHGSGNIDRNGNQGEMIKASYIPQLADSLNTYNIAVFRYDKRTANPKNLALEEIQNIRFEDFAYSNAEKLHQANPESQLRIIPNMTHTLKFIENPADNMLTYSQPNFPLSSELVKTIVEFINQ